MIKTETVVTSLADVPREWIFEYYLNLNEKLTGQTVMILSPFNPNDKRPSFSVYVSNSNDAYRFKDFSTNLGGDAVALVEKLFNLSTRGEAAHKILQDYQKWVVNNTGDYDSREFKPQVPYKIKDFSKAPWTKLDQRYWSAFNIGSRLLEKYNVAPLSSYTMVKEGTDESFTIADKSFIYGYFREDGTLYKIYQPMNKVGKFIKIRDYIQGTDQLTMQKKYLIICSSLKDVMAFDLLGYKDAEAVAPDSENTLITPHVISAYQLKYKRLCTLFDNDEAGLTGMYTYKEKYNIPMTILPLSKDLSDSVRDHGVLKVKQVLTPLLKQALQ